MISLVVTPILVAVGFAPAGIFVSRVESAAGSSFLLKGNSCGRWQFGDDPLETLGFSVKMLTDATNAANYAENCYEASNSTGSQCSTYYVPAIPYTVDKNASCPFQSESCIWSDTAAYSMDTGCLDSHEILGLNAPVSERITVRKATTCAPLTLDPYIELLNKTIRASGLGGTALDLYIQLYVGLMAEVQNFTWEYDTRQSVIGIGYGLDAIWALAAWEPISAFTVSNADVTLLIFTSNNVVYTYPNLDIMFSANDGLVHTTDYMSDYFFTALMCADSYQICNPTLDNNNMNCTRLGSMENLISDIPYLGLNAPQLWTANLVAELMLPANMYGAVYGRGSSALKAQKTIVNIDIPQQMAQIPSNQWQLELAGWCEVSLAVFQQMFVEYASGLEGVLEYGGQIIPPPNLTAKALCSRQMVRNISGYQNFNTIGVAIILVVGISLILIGLCIDTVVGFVQKLIIRHYARLSRTSDGYLQLQRMAYEGAGYEGWKDCASNQPIFIELKEEPQTLGGLDIWDIENPRLAKISVDGTGNTQERKPLV